MIQITEGDKSLDSADARFAIGSWLKSYRTACLGGERGAPPQDMAQYLIRNMEPEAYTALMRPHVYRLMSEPENVLLVASLEEDRDMYVGWALGRKASGLPAVLHYVYVKQRYRKLGVCYKMLGELLTKPTAKGFYTCQTWEWFQVILDQSNTWIYRPKIATKGHDEKTTTAQAPA